MQKSDSIHRLIAKVIDLVIVGLLCTPQSWAGTLAGAVYILICDGFFDGQSVGKKLIGLKVIVDSPTGRRACSFKDSILRNSLFGAGIVLGVIPWIGWFLSALLGLLFWPAEAYFVYADDEGIRIGDILAGTRVLDDVKPQA